MRRRCAPSRFQPEEVAISCGVLHSAPVNYLSLFVDLDVLADNLGRFVFLLLESWFNRVFVIHD